MFNIVQSSISQSPGLAASDLPAGPEKRRRRFKQNRLPAPQVSDATRERLYAEAARHPAFEGIELQEIKAFIDERLAEFLAKQPFWYGHTGGHGGADTRHHSAHRQYEARRDKPERHARKDGPQESPSRPRSKYVSLETIDQDTALPIAA